ncbi:MAG TPA: ATP-grasp domain-containing protein [Gemmatimonadales bacterium]|nr:ATP-grasp domain-containing protein [Gemmatimonadales bacterium]
MLQGIAHAFDDGGRYGTGCIPVYDAGDAAHQDRLLAVDLQQGGVTVTAERKGNAMSTVRIQAARRRLDAADAARENGFRATPRIITRRRGARVLLTDGDDRVSLAVARSLVSAGYDVHVTAAHHLSLAGVSRGVHAHYVRWHPLERPVDYAWGVGSLARRLDAEVLIPISDESTESVLENADALPADISLPTPSLYAYRTVCDKALMLERAKSAGLGTPETIVLPNRQARNIPPEWFPIVLKPRRSVVSAEQMSVWGKRVKTSVAFVAKPEDLTAALARIPAAAFPVLAQRRVQGAGVGIFLLRWNGEYVAEFAHRRIREKPPAGGVSVYRESVPVDPVLGAAAKRLLDRLDWRGVAMVECKRDETTGEPLFMEVNGRFWGSLQLAIDAGVDFPSLLVACAFGRHLHPVTRYDTGIRGRWFWGDVDHLYLRLTKSPEALHLPPDEQSRAAIIRDFLRSRRGDREDVFRWLDPLPFAMESVRRLMWQG